MFFGTILWQKAAGAQEGTQGDMCQGLGTFTTLPIAPIVVPFWDYLVGI